MTETMTEVGLSKERALEAVIAGAHLFFAYRKECPVAGCSSWTPIDQSETAMANLLSRTPRALGAFTYYYASSYAVTVPQNHPAPFKEKHMAHIQAESRRLYADD